MIRPRAKLGDLHNFGRRVELDGERVRKPRTVLWEWLVLCAESPLRRLLDSAAEQEHLGAGAFAFLPSLKFSRWREKTSGEVERIRLHPLRASARTQTELATVVGRALALFSWLGVADLHWENLVLGRDEAGRIVFGPLDIEMILADLSLPTETKLLPDADPEYAEICRHAAGARRALAWLGKPVDAPHLLSMAAAYRATLVFLDRHSAALARAIASAPGLREAPLRVLLRGTDEYVRAHLQPLWPPLLDAEREQLERGDIPYFFRLYGKPGIHYYAEPSLKQLGRLPLAGDVPQLDPLLQLSRNLRSPSRKRLREDGLFTLLGAFDHAALTGTHAHPELTATFGPRRIVLRLPDGEELHSRRNLRAFVSSVYLDCSCGEVRSVFVPPVTVCQSGRASV
jgi:hypothetical protein